MELIYLQINYECRYIYRIDIVDISTYMLKKDSIKNIVAENYTKVFLK